MSYAEGACVCVGFGAALATVVNGASPVAMSCQVKSALLLGANTAPELAVTNQMSSQDGL
jgi:hypothetical protein